MLRRAIRSVQAQSFGDWELIVVDDASTDETAAAMAEVTDARVHCVHRAVNGGVAAAQNTGLDRATGRYVAFLHSDDEFLPPRLSALVDTLDRSPGAAGVESGFELIERESRTVRPPYLHDATARDLIAYRVGVHISTLLLRTEEAVAIRFDERLRGTEDRDFCIRLLRRGRVVTRPEPLIRIDRTHPRLGTQPKGVIYEYLLAKYAEEIVPFADVHAAWWFRIARSYARAGEMRSARGAMRRAVSAYPRRARRWPLLAASLVSDPVFAVALRSYLAMAALANPLRAPEPSSVGRRQ